METLGCQLYCAQYNTFRLSRLRPFSIPRVGLSTGLIGNGDDTTACGHPFSSSFGTSRHHVLFSTEPERSPSQLFSSASPYRLSRHGCCGSSTWCLSSFRQSWVEFFVTGTDFVRVRRAMFWTSVPCLRKTFRVSASSYNRKDVVASWEQEYYVRRCGVTCHCCCGSLEADCCGSGSYRLLRSRIHLRA